MRVGKYFVPEHGLFPVVVDAANKIREKHKSEPSLNNLIVAILLGHQSVSGPYLEKMGNVRSYGLIEKRGFGLTDLGNRITDPVGDNKRNDAIKEAVLNIPLWSELYKKFGVNIPEENFWPELKVIAGISDTEAQTIAEYVRSRYIEDIKHIQQSASVVNNNPSKNTVAKKEDITIISEPTVKTQIVESINKPVEQEKKDVIESKPADSLKDYRVLNLDGVEIFRILRSEIACTLAEQVIKEIRKELSGKGGSK